MSRNVTKDDKVHLIPSQKILRRMGIIKDQNGIYRRYQQERDNWELHLSNTKRFIAECVQDSGAKRIAVMGSGWMLDIPVDFLAEHFESIVFYDLRHPPFILHKFKNYPNFHFVRIDVTGGLITKIYRLCSGWKKPGITKILDEIKVPYLRLSEPVDYIVSVNLLNQLDILLIDYIQRYYKLDIKTELAIRKRIQEAHLRLLLPRKSCLITDYEEVHLDNHNSIVGKHQLVHCTLPAGMYRRTWTWNFDTRKTYYPDHMTAMNVIAIKM